MSGTSSETDIAFVPGGDSGRAENALQGLYEISKILAAPGRLEAVQSSVLRTLSRFVEMRRGLIALIDEAGRATAAVGFGWGEGDARAHFGSLPESLARRLVATRQPFFSSDIAREPLLADWPGQGQGDGRGSGQGLGATAVVAAPIEQRNRVIGALIVERAAREGACDDEEDARFLAMIGAMIGQTLHFYDVVTRDRERLMEEQRQLEKEAPRASALQGEQALSGIVGASPAIRTVFNQINVVARTHTTLLLRGESGTGKELFARAAHELSPRKHGPFIRLNCAALSDSLLESELFGHEAGSFTGVLGQRKGRFELADKGTLFLDEIGDISPAFQAKLLRVLQEGEFERVGGSQTVKVDVRFVFATNRNLEWAVEHGLFRADLYYRINVVSILLPPLRERPEDIGPLAQEFLGRFNDENGTRKKLTALALKRLQRCWFPGNVRELEHCVRRAAALSDDDGICDGHFSCSNNACLSSTLMRDFAADAPTMRAGENGCADSRAQRVPVSARRAVRRDSEIFERSSYGAPDRDRLIDAMEKAGWVQAKAARLLNLTPRQIAYALGKHRIPIKKF